MARRISLGCATAQVVRRLTSSLSLLFAFALNRSLSAFGFAVAFTVPYPLAPVPNLALFFPVAYCLWPVTYPFPIPWPLSPILVGLCFLLPTTNY